ncbi:uncharacterized protein LOC106665008 [Cimex lectularius]|uniref:Protein sleepless n=1 Tax=Cimex lectularius TaxID=79782 RepID=A0A8I6SME3_CIMLE|nr:uncharacterized protein LOC106665008 [Cimex lectularius]
MDRSLALISTFALVFFFTFQTGSALKCFECNSFNDSRCALEVPPEALSKECSTHQNSMHKYILCRKIVQTIEYEVNGLPPDSRVIRSCGWDDSSYLNACYQRSGFGGRQEVCSCTTNLCNSATAAGVAMLFVTSLLAFPALL